MDGPEFEALQGRVAQLERSLRVVETLLGRCAVATAAASVTALAIGREMSAVVAASGQVPALDPLLARLEAQIEALKTVSETRPDGG
jgi:hypothetical protein